MYVVCASKIIDKVKHIFYCAMSKMDAVQYKNGNYEEIFTERKPRILSANEKLMLDYIVEIYIKLKQSTNTDANAADKLCSNFKVALDILLYQEMKYLCVDFVALKKPSAINDDGSLTIGEIDGIIGGLTFTKNTHSVTYKLSKNNIQPTDGQKHSLLQVELKGKNPTNFDWAMYDKNATNSTTSNNSFDFAGLLLK